MPNEGPTTVGSIVGRLSMDRDQWLADKAKTQADARELGSLNPTIRVDIDTAAAMARVEALRVATERRGVSLPTSNVQSTVPVNALAAAMGRLDAVTAALAASQEADNDAMREASLLALREQLNMEALSHAERSAAAAALEKAAAEETAAGATVEANEANKTSVSRMGLITSAVALLLPLLVPVAAGAIGIAGGLTMMGAAGVLAVVGIRREMQQGTATGKAYSEGLQSLRFDMNQLAQTSALNMLSSFRRVVGDTSGAMPMLNRQVGEFTGILGRSGGNLFAGSINGLRVLEPLLLTAGLYVERLTRQFNEWTQNGGLEKFAGYALSTLPQVEHVLGALATAIMHILEALAPLGQIGMAVLTGISDGINGIPVDVLGAMIGALTWGMLAFKAWGFVAPMLSGIASAMGAVGAATTIATGPIGWVVAGIAALVAVISVATINTQNATNAVATYTSAVQADTGAIGDNVKAAAVKALQDAGALDAAKRLGISLDLVTRATLGDTAAKKELNAELKVQEDRLKKTADASTGASGADLKRAQDVDLLTGAYKGENAGINETIDAYNRRQEAMGLVTIATDAQRQAVEANAKAAGVSVQAYLGAMAAQGDAKAQFERTTATMYLQSDAAGLLKQSLDLLNGKTLNAEQAQNQFDSQIANMSKHINAQGKEINRADTLLTGMTASAVKNRGELINLTSAAEANAQAFRDNGGSAEDTKQKLIDMKKEIIENAIAHGEDAAQVQAFLDKIFQIPDKIPPTKIEVDADTAYGKIMAVQAALRQLPGQVGIHISTGIGGQGGQVIGNANGGTIGMAGGGTAIGPGSSKSDSIATMLSLGEEVIQEPWATRFRPELKMMNQGIDPTKVNTQRQLPPVIHTHYWKITANDPVALFQSFQNRTHMLGAV